MTRAAIVILALGLTACSSSRSKDDEPTTIPPPQPVSPSTDVRLNELQTSLTELLERLDVLNTRIARLEEAQGEQRAASSERVITPNPVPAPRKAITPQPLQTAQIADHYRQALMLFAQGRHADARAAFQQVFDADPSGQLADNALFWIGETYFAAGDYKNATRYYTRVTNEYADQNKAPDAMFKTGMAFEKTGDLGMARRTFEECIRKYPYSTSATAARTELKRIKY